MAANPDDILLQRLQKTIDSWSTEVTAAHEGLARQIGDARSQLHALLQALDQRHTAPTANGNGLRAQALEERDAALREVVNRNEELQAGLRKAEDERAAMRSEIHERREEAADLRGQIQAYQDQERAGAALLEQAQKELDALRLSVDATTGAREHTEDEIATLRRGVEGALRDRDGLRTERDRLEVDLGAARRVIQEQELEVQSLSKAVDLLREETATLRASRDTIGDDLLADLKTAEYALEQQNAELRALRAERDELVQRREHAIERAREAESIRQSAAEELMHLREVQDHHMAVEVRLRAEIDTLGKTVESLRQSERDLGEELSSLNHEYERQAQRLAENVKELEAHWELATSSKSTEERLEAQVAELNGRIGESDRELDALRKALDSALVAADTSNLDAHVRNMQTENEELRMKLAELEAAHASESAGQTAEIVQSDKELETLREELLSFEQLLIEREEAVEGAAGKMRRLEETAVLVQSEVARLRALHEGAAGSEDAGAAAERDAARMEAGRARRQADDLAILNEEQASRLIAQELRVRQQDEEIESLKQRLAAQREVPMVAAGAKPELRYAFDAHDESGHKRSMGEILVDAGIITHNQLESALEEQRTAQKRRLGSILVEKGLIREEIIAKVVASQLKLLFERISDLDVDRSAVSLMDGRLATHHMCFPIRATSEELTIAMANPLDLIAIEDLEFATHLKIRPVVATLSDITSAIVEHYGVTIANAIAEDTFDVQTPPSLPKQSVNEKT